MPQQYAHDVDLALHSGVHRFPVNLPREARAPSIGRRDRPTTKLALLRGIWCHEIE